MRIWTPHPRYLDRQRLQGAWAEGLAIQSIRLNNLSGYAEHPQTSRLPLSLLHDYLWSLYHEGRSRGIAFNATLIVDASPTLILQCVTKLQLAYECALLRRKQGTKVPLIANSIFHVTSGHILEETNVNFALIAEARNSCLV